MYQCSALIEKSGHFDTNSQHYWRFHELFDRLHAVVVGNRSGQGHRGARQGARTQRVHRCRTRLGRVAVLAPLAALPGHHKSPFHRQHPVLGGYAPRRPCQHDGPTCIRTAAEQLRRGGREVLVNYSY